MKRNPIAVIVLTLFVFAGLLGFSSCGNLISIAWGDDTPLQKISFLLDWRSEPAYAGIYIAKEQGLYRKAGIDLDIVEGNGATLSATTIGVGNQQFIGTCSAAATAIARSKDVPVKSAAVLYPETPTVLYSLGRTPIEKPQDLIGHRVGLIQGSVTVDEYRALLTANKIDRSQIQEISVGWDATSLLNNQTDCLLTYEDNVPVQLRLKGYDVRLLRLRDFGVQTYSLNIVVNDKAMTEHADEIKKVTEASIAGYQFVRDHPDEASDIFIHLFPERDPQYVRASMKVVAALIGKSEVGQQTHSGWQHTLDTLTTLKLLDKPVTVDDVTVPGYVKND